MKSNKKTSLQTRFLIALIIMAIVLIAIVWFMQIYMLDTSYRRIRTRDVKEATNEVVNMLIDGDNYDEISKFSMDRGVSIIIENRTDNTAIILNPMQLENILGINSKDRLEQLMSLPNDYVDKTLYITNTRRPGGLGIYDTSISDINSNDVNAIAYFYGNSEINSNSFKIIGLGEIMPLNATVMTLRTQLIYISAFLILIAVILAYFLSKSISKPITEITDEANQLAMGNFDIHFNDSNYEEISQLSHTLNYTAVQLKKADQITKDLIANVSHDLRTPLTMISGYGEVMRDIPGEAKPENIQVIIDEANRLTNLVNNMLEISKLQAGAIDINKTSINASEFASKIYNTYSKMLENSDYTFVLNNSLQDVYFLGDNMRLEQVFYNLINNALAHVGEDKTVEITAKTTDDNCVYFAITDHGVGISEENKALIWNRYFRITDQNLNMPTGSGLGLSIVKSILELHDATYGVDSEVGKGSTFWFKLPIEEA